MISIAVGNMPVTWSHRGIPLGIFRGTAAIDVRSLSTEEQKSDNLWKKK